jgi:hypothetical protein
MHSPVASGAQRDQILFLVPAGLAAELEVMHLQLFHAAAELAAPAVALQHPTVKFAVAVRVEPQSRILGWDLLHEACPASSDRKASCWGAGRNL